jgi:flagellin-specific chaperone FliS
MMRLVEAAYRKATAASVSGLGLLIALYDELAGDLREAAEAERRNDIAVRCRKANHALLVIGHLEQWLERGQGGELADQLKVFYGSLRRNIIAAQAKRSSAMLEEQMAQVLEVRTQWQRLAERSATSEPFILPPVVTRRPGPFSPATEQRRKTWSA